MLREREDMPQPRGAVRNGNDLALARREWNLALRHCYMGTVSVWRFDPRCAILATMKPKRPRDTNQLAKFIVDRSIGEVQNDDTEPTAKALAGRLGGLKGGQARAETLGPERRKAIARKAVTARWPKKKSEP